MIIYMYLGPKWPLNEKFYFQLPGVPNYDIGNFYEPV